MTDTKLLKERIEVSGLVKEYIIDRLGLDYKTYITKENGKCDFTVAEIQTLKQILNISDKGIRRIFFNVLNRF